MKSLHWLFFKTCVGFVCGQSYLVTKPISTYFAAIWWPHLNNYSHFLRFAKWYNWRCRDCRKGRGMCWKGFYFHLWHKKNTSGGLTAYLSPSSCNISSFKGWITLKTTSSTGRQPSSFSWPVKWVPHWATVSRLPRHWISTTALDTAQWDWTEEPETT